MQEISETPNIAVGERFLAALEEQNFDRLEAGFHPTVRFRAVLPPRNCEEGDAAGATGWLRRWFDDADELEIVSSAVDWVVDRLHITYRIKCHKPDGWRVIEQHVYCTVNDGRIEDMALVCSGFRPDPERSEDGPVASRNRSTRSNPITKGRPPRNETDEDATTDPDVVVEAYGQSCGLLEPILKARMAELDSGQILEVRSDDPSVPDGIAAWSRLTGNELLSSDLEDDGDARFRLQKKQPPEKE